MKHIAFLFVFSTILLCSCGSKGTKESQNKITAEMALEGVSNYCHSESVWSLAHSYPYTTTLPKTRPL